MFNFRLFFKLLLDNGPDPCVRLDEEIPDSTAN